MRRTVAETRLERTRFGADLVKEKDDETLTNLRLRSDSRKSLARSQTLSPVRRKRTPGESSRKHSVSSTESSPNTPRVALSTLSSLHPSRQNRFSSTDGVISNESTALQILQKPTDGSESPVTEDIQTQQPLEHSKSKSPNSPLSNSPLSNSPSSTSPSRLRKSSNPGFLPNLKLPGNSLKQELAMTAGSLPSSPLSMTLPCVLVKAPFSPSPQDTGHWRHLRNAVYGTNAFKNGDILLRGSFDSASSSRRYDTESPPKNAALRRREEYGRDLLKQQTEQMATGCLKLERFIIKVSDILALKNLFDDIDFDRSGTVSMDEVCLHRKHHKMKMETYGKEISKEHIRIENMMIMMLSIDEQLTFQDMLKKTYPMMTAEDIKLCIAQLPAEKEKAKPKKRMSQNFWKEFEESDEYWQLYAEPDGSMTKESFDLLVEIMLGDQLEDDAIKAPDYDKLANPDTRKIHRKEFTQWWLTMYRDSPYNWDDIEEDVQAFWKKNSKDDE